MGKLLLRCPPDGMVRKIRDIHNRPVRLDCNPLCGPGRKHGTPISGWKQQLVPRIGVPDHSCGRESSDSKAESPHSVLDAHQSNERRAPRSACSRTKKRPACRGTRTCGESNELLEHSPSAAPAQPGCPACSQPTGAQSDRVATLCVARRSHAAPTTLLFEHGTNELLELPPPPIRLS